MRSVEAQPFLVEARERPVEKMEPLPNPGEGAGTAPITLTALTTPIGVSGGAAASLRRAIARTVVAAPL